MNIKHLWAALLLPALLLLGSCDLIDDEDSSIRSVVNEDAADPSTVLAVLAVFDLTADDDPLEIADPDAFLVALNSIFGGPGDEPLEIIPGETIGDLLDRASMR